MVADARPNLLEKLVEAETRDLRALLEAGGKRSVAVLVLVAETGSKSAVRSFSSSNATPRSFIENWADVAEKESIRARKMTQ